MKKIFSLLFAFVLTEAVFSQNTTDGNAKPNVIPKTTIDKAEEGNTSSTTKSTEGAAGASTTQKPTEGAADAGNAPVSTKSKSKTEEEENKAVKKKPYYKKVAKFKARKAM